MSQDHLFSASFIYAPAWSGVDPDPQLETPETAEEAEENETRPIPKPAAAPRHVIPIEERLRKAG